MSKEGQPFQTQKVTTEKIIKAPEVFGANFERGDSIVFKDESSGKEIAGVVIYQETTPAGRQCLWFELPSGKIDFVFPGKKTITKQPVANNPKLTTLPTAKALADNLFTEESPIRLVWDQRQAGQPGLRALAIALNQAGIMNRGSVPGQNNEQKQEKDSQETFFYPTIEFKNDFPLDESGNEVPLKLKKEGTLFTIYPAQKDPLNEETYIGNHETQLLQYLLQSGILEKAVQPGLADKLPELLQITRVAITLAKLNEHRLPLISSTSLEKTANDEANHRQQLKAAWNAPLESWLLNAHNLPNTLYQMAADQEFCRRLLGLETSTPLPDLNADWLRDNKLPQENVWKERLSTKKSFLGTQEPLIHPEAKIELTKIWDERETNSITNRKRILPTSYYAYIHQKEVLKKDHPVIKQGLAKKPDYWTNDFRLDGKHPTLGATAINIPLSKPTTAQIGDKTINLTYSASALSQFVGTPEFPIQSQLRFFVQKNDGETYQCSGFEILAPDNQRTPGTKSLVKKLLVFLTSPSSTWGQTFQKLQAAGCLYTSGDHYLGINTRNKPELLTEGEYSFLEPVTILKILNLIQTESIAAAKRNIYQKYESPNYFGGTRNAS